MRRRDVKLIHRRNRPQRRFRAKFLVALDVDVTRPKSIRQRTVDGIGQENPQPRASSYRNESATVHVALFDCTTT